MPCFPHLVRVGVHGYSACIQVWEYPFLGIRDFGKSLCAWGSDEGGEDPASIAVCAFSRFSSFPNRAPASSAWGWMLRNLGLFSPPCFRWVATLVEGKESNGVV